MFRSRLVPPPLVQIIAIMAMAFVLIPARSAEPPIEGKVDDTKRMVDLLERIEKRLATQEARTDVMLDLVKTDIKQLRDEVSRLQKEVGELRRTSNSNSTSNYPSQSASSPSISASVAAPQGRVRLVNNYVTDMTAVVNGTPVPVAPGRYVDVIVPPGTVTYQVPLMRQPTKATTLAANEMLTLTLFPM